MTLSSTDLLCLKDNIKIKKNWNAKYFANHMHLLQQTISCVKVLQNTHGALASQLCLEPFQRNRKISLKLTGEQHLWELCLFEDLLLRHCGSCLGETTSCTTYWFIPPVLTKSPMHTGTKKSQDIARRQNKHHVC